MNKENIQVGIWKTYNAHSLEIAPSLVSASHSFIFEGYAIEIKLPKRPKKKDWNKERSPITCWGWRIRGKVAIPLSYSVHKIEVTLDTGKERKIRKDAIGLVNIGLFSKRERTSLKTFGHRYNDILDAAYEYWIDVMRWCTAQPTIGHPYHQMGITDSGVNLIDIKNKKRFYHTGFMHTVAGNEPVTKKEWNKAQDILTEGKTVPIWEIYYAEAYNRLEYGDMRGFIISLAISSETLFRHLSISFLKEPINTKYQSIVNRVPISSLINNWKKLGFNNKDWKSVESERKSLLRLFEIRNGIVHRGSNPTISEEEQVELGTAVKRFMELCDKYG